MGVHVPSFDQVPHSIHGYVLDSSGEPLPGVEVMLEGRNMEFSKVHITDRDGAYHFDCLEKGVYSLTFKLTGFITKRMENFTIKPASSFELNRELQLDPAAEDTFIFPADSPAKALVVTVRDNRSSDYLENVHVAIYEGDVRKESHSTNACGNATIFLDPGIEYLVRISKDGFEEKVINLEMSREPKRLDARLNPIN